MSEIYLQSDNHWSHQNIIKYCNRPFSCVEEMDIAMVEMWNKSVGPNDTVYYLGDFAMKFHKIEEFLPQLNGHIKYIPGNHCAFHPLHSGWRNTLIRFHKIKVRGSVEVLDTQVTKTFGNHSLLFCHFPWAGDVDRHSDEHNKYEDRYKEWRPKRENYPGFILCHGHDHLPPESRVGDRSISVAYDSWGRMVHIDEILEIIKEEGW